jgi:predicted dienelactone hydrolase
MRQKITTQCIRQTPDQLEQCAHYAREMRRVGSVILLGLAAAAYLTSCSEPGQNDLVVVNPETARSIEYKIWLPETDEPAPLIIISHGTSGHNSDHIWLADALVQNGFAVAALNHPHDTRMDRSVEGLIRVWDRPVDISFLLSHLLEDPQWSKSIDRSRIAAAGYSSGGYTVIALAGGIFDPRLMGEYCNSPQKGPECDLVKSTEVATIDYSNAGRNYRDERIKAVYAMAPALGPGMLADELAKISIPVGIITAKDDGLITPANHAEHYARHIPNATLEYFPKGGHFVYVTTCTIIPSIVDFFITEIDLCGREIDADRESVQIDIANTAVKFFSLNLAETQQ